VALDTIGKLVPSDMFSKTMLSCNEEKGLVNPRRWRKLGKQVLGRRGHTMKPGKSVILVMR
jgi:hypothetical protein